MLKLRVTNETDRLKAVILGTAVNSGAAPTLEEACDPKSAEHIKADTYPIEKGMVAGVDTFAAVLQKYGMQVYRPEIIRNYDQIFTHDIGFVIDNVFVKADILPDEQAEFQAIEYIVKRINPDKVVTPPEKVHIEGGDVMPWNEHIFTDTYEDGDYKEQVTACTNMTGVASIQRLFPHKEVKKFGLVKSKTEARDDALHLDCCFQPIGKGKVIAYKEGFRLKADCQYSVDIFGTENPFHIEREEIYEMNNNVFSISPRVVVSEEHFTRFNTWLRAQGFTVEEIPYSEIPKQEGLLRCSILPLLGDN